MATPDPLLDKAKWRNPWWRLNNLYHIVTDDRQEMRFRPNEEQAHFWMTMWLQELILKARQRGFTTFVDLIALDQCVFNPNFTASIIAHTLPDAEKIFRNKVLFAYERLPSFVRSLAPIKKQSSSELVFANGSSISVSTSNRGGTVQLLHVSEMGKIARKYPDKAEEIVNGAFRAVPVTKGGRIIVESTAEGRSGWFYKQVQIAKRRRDQGAKDTPLDFRLHFYPWWGKAAYRLSERDAEAVIFTDEQLEYFERVESLIKRRLTREQRAWYVKVLATSPDDEAMKREFPSYEDEAFEVSTEGLIFGKQMVAARKGGRIGKVPVRPDILLRSYWDLGVNDTNTIWVEQQVGSMHRFVRYFAGSNEGMDYYHRKLEDWRKAMAAKLGVEEHRLRWGAHYLPHDGDTRVMGHELFTRKQLLEELGFRNIEIVKRIDDKRNAIAMGKAIFPECEFDEEGCAEGIDCLDNYSREWNEDRGEWASYPRHDKFSHGADSWLQFAQWHRKVAEDRRPGGMAASSPSWATVRGGY
ncbi:MAG: hypothetical protein HY856_13555 [Burkholderiales bacterium]|nr:hypothetical protein [Burkholderiales bacterium]